MTEYEEIWRNIWIDFLHRLRDIVKVEKVMIAEPEMKTNTVLTKPTESNFINEMFKRFTTVLERGYHQND